MPNESELWMAHTRMLSAIGGRLRYISHIAEKMPVLSLSTAAQSMEILYEQYQSWSSALIKAVIVGEHIELMNKSHNDLRRWWNEQLAAARALHAQFASILATIPPIEAEPLPEALAPGADDDEGEDPWFRDEISIGGSAMSERFMPFLLMEFSNHCLRNSMIAEAVAVHESLKAATEAAQFCFWFNMRMKHGQD
jgi:hypothetical protein